MRTSWSREIIVTTIKRLHMEKVALNSGSIRKTHLNLYGAAHQYFGGWKQAIEASGFKYSEVSVLMFKAPRRTWSNDQIIATILGLRDKGDDLNSRYVAQKHSRLYAVACYHFGSWKQALKAAGLNEKIIRKMPEIKEWSKEVVIAAIKSRQSLGLSLNSRSVESSDILLYHAGLRHFGGWGLALEAAGLDPNDIYLVKTVSWTKSEFVEAIEALRNKNVKLSMVNMVRLGRSDLLNASRKLYGGWKEAMQSLGLNYEDIRERRDPWTAEEVIAVIRHLANEGHRLNHGWAKLNHNGLTHSARFHFGKWDMALAAAGLNYREHAKYWSTEAWVRHLSDKDYDSVIGKCDKDKT